MPAGAVWRVDIGKGGRKGSIKKLRKKEVACSLAEMRLTTTNYNPMNISKLKGRSRISFSGRWIKPG